MAAAYATRLPHPRPGIEPTLAVGPRLLIRQGKPAYFAANHLEAVPLCHGRGWQQLQLCPTTRQVAIIS